MSNVVDLPVISTLARDPARILAKAHDAGLTDVVIIGHDKDGREFFASSKADGGDVVWMLERAKLKLLSLVPD